MAVATRGTASNYLQRAPSPSGLVDVVDETKEKVREVTSRDGKKKSSLAKRVLVPLAASAVSGATAYAARKAPGFFQEKVLPKLKEAAQSGGKLDKAKEAVEDAVSG